MKISILLPYKENFSPLYPGAVSLFINSMNKLSNYSEQITVFGSTNLSEKFSDNYVNIELKKSFLRTVTRTFIKFSTKVKNKLFDLFSFFKIKRYFCLFPLTYNTVQEILVIPHILFLLIQIIPFK